MTNTMSQVALMNTDNRKHGVKASLGALKINPVKGKDVLIKPNFNTADPTQGSTHNDTLAALVEEIWEMGAKSISLGERSYPPTLEVMEKKGILSIMDKMDVRVIDFDDLDDKDWVLFKPKKSHWTTVAQEICIFFLISCSLNFFPFANLICTHPTARKPKTPTIRYKISFPTLSKFPFKNYIFWFTA